MNSVRVAAACACFLVAAGYSTAEQGSIEIAAHVFLGQAYPSGKVYLVPFPLPDDLQSVDDYVQSYRWPQSVTYQPFSGTPASAIKPRSARFLGVMHDAPHEIGPNIRQLESAYIPSLESMDDRHEGCTKSLYKPKNPQYRYEGEDFFEQLFSSCAPNEGTGMYEGRPGMVSFSVVAFDKSAQLSDVQYLNGKPRPVTKAELAEIARGKCVMGRTQWTFHGKAYLHVG